MQYTIRNIPKAVDKALRQRAQAEGKSLNETAIDLLSRGLGVKKEPVRYRDLDFLVGTLKDDPEFDRILEEQRQIDPELWT